MIVKRDCWGTGCDGRSGRTVAATVFVILAYNGSSVETKRCPVGTHIEYGIWFMASHMVSDYKDREWLASEQNKGKDLLDGLKYQAEDLGV